MMSHRREEVGCRRCRLHIGSIGDFVAPKIVLKAFLTTKSVISCLQAIIQIEYLTVEQSKNMIILPFMSELLVL